MNEIRMPDINTVTIAGNLTRDPAFRKTTNGTPVANFWIASNRKFKDNNGHWRENVCYVGVVAWYKLAENCSENLKKGSAVIIEGELQSRTLRNEDGRNRSIVEIKAHRVQFLNKKEQQEDRNDGLEQAGMETHYASTHESVDASHAPEIAFSGTEAAVPAKDQLPAPDAGADAPESDDFAQDESEPENPNPNSGKFDFGYQDFSV